MVEQFSNTGRNAESQTFDVDEYESVTTAVVRAVSTASATPADEFPPLHYAVDADALETLCGRLPEGGTVEFVFNGYEVTVTGDESVELRSVEA